MKIQFASDLHLEFPLNKEFLKSNPLKPAGDLLILAGDIVPFAAMDKHQDFFDYIAANFRQTWWLPGNHEYYRSEFTLRSGTLQEKIRPNIHLVNNLTVFHNNVRFIFSTLWSAIQPGYQWDIEKGVSDFHLIRHKGNRINSELYNRFHDDCLAFVKSELNEKNYAKTVVVTHHAPTFQHYNEEYIGSTLNGAFATELSDMVAKSNADCWIYGHLHHNVTEYYIGKTKMLTNQLGYVEFGEHKSFRTDRVFKL